MRKRYAVELTEDERGYLKGLIAAGAAPARKLTHARILLKADQAPGGPAWVDAAIAEAVEVSQPTVFRVRRQYVEQGVDAALHRRPPTRVYARKLSGEQEARLVALSCSAPPAGEARWSLRLLADRLVELEVVEAISYQTVRRVLLKTSSSRGRRSSGASRPRPTPSSSGGWRTSWRSTPAPPTRAGRWSAWTRRASSSCATRGRRSRRPPG
ncbi:MAG TPA: helix-turn-helix domain-containing protein, partial [Chloroflexota bacterium]|nr:helix-turn-helix domain-containing protein [Chloroflexota bacterium]